MTRIIDRLIDRAHALLACVLLLASLVAAMPRFDRYVGALEETGRPPAGVLTEDEVAGLRLFTGKARCIQCTSRRASAASSRASCGPWAGRAARDPLPSSRGAGGD